MAALGQKKETTHLLPCPVCREQIEATVTFDVKANGVNVPDRSEPEGFPLTLSLALSAKAVGLTIRHSCLPEKENAPGTPVRPPDL
jgi:hypothetical protein